MPSPREVPLPRVAIAHDYLTQRGGAERVVLAMHRAFPDAPIATTLFDPDGTYPEFGDLDVRVSGLDRIAPLRHHHRLALPLLAPAVDHLTIDAEVVLVSSSGWAHGVHTTGRKVVYCHSPARWLYVDDQENTTGLSARMGKAAMALLGPRLKRWDRRAAYTADVYLANSKVTQQRIRDAYGIDAEVLHPPVAVDVHGPREALVTASAGKERELESGFLLVVARLMPYKNIDAVAQAVAAMADVRLVIVGSGPAEADVRAAATPAGDRITLLDRVTDAELRWLYANASALVCAAPDDFGLTPVEAAAFGTPTVGIRAAGLLETIVEDETGVFFDEPTPQAISSAIERLSRERWDEQRIREHADTFSEARFADRLHRAVAEVRS